MKKLPMKPFFQILLITLLLNISIASLVGQEVKSLPQPNLFIKKGLEDLKSQDYEQAALEFQQAIKADPENALAYDL